MKLSASIHLHEKSNSRFQFIYAGQLYGTFFAVYGKFTVNEKYLTKIDLLLINYMGTINIGIKSAIIENTISRRSIVNYGSENEDIIEIDCITLQLNVQGLNGINKSEKSLVCNFYLTDNLYFEVNRKLEKLPKDYEQYVFDSEFKYREGLGPVTDLNRHVNKIIAAPGGICPRGYSKIITS